MYMTHCHCHSKYFYKSYKKLSEKLTVTFIEFSFLWVTPKAFGNQKILVINIKSYGHHNKRIGIENY